MIPEQVITTVEPAALRDEAARRHAGGWRLVQICCTTLAETFEINYSFALPGRFEHLRVVLPRATPTVTSITPSYSAAFAYENEIHDLFGVTFEGLTLNYNGAFFKTSVATAFKDAPCVLNPPLPPKYA